jgi:pachytene checkpoint protein 2
MSGRALRRLPVLALARYIGMGCVAGFQPHPDATEPSQGAPIELWLEGLELAVNDIAKEKEIMM